MLKMNKSDYSKKAYNTQLVISSANPNLPTGMSPDHFYTFQYELAFESDLDMDSYEKEIIDITIDYYPN